MMVIPIIVGAFGTHTKGLIKGRKVKRENHLNDSIIKINQNTKNPGKLRRLAVTLTPVEDPQLKQVRKTLKE